MKNLKKFIPPVKKPRLSGWLLTSVLLLGTIALVSPQQLPVDLQAGTHHAGSSAGLLA